MEIRFQNIGWKSRITQKRSTLGISINKLVATGCSLEKGQALYCYLAEDEDKRAIMVVYLDAKEKGIKVGSPNLLWRIAEDYLPYMESGLKA
ncbi:hypothetical protein KY366_03230 [Candidatus Woesearchaeota archaeon]|nr:hypothetical protein [Candidatus Woesearchaeota archaeon]